MSDFSLTLNEDQLQIQKWVHEFAENVVRPAGPEWDEREETPWPIIKEAAKNGLYSFDFIAQCVDLRLHPGRGRHLRQRHARADRRVDPPVLRDRR
jgi:alkylation response protein AidB-like acyl-CoA dehydrogenase